MPREGGDDYDEEGWDDDDGGKLAAGGGAAGAGAGAGAKSAAGSGGTTRPASAGGARAAAGGGVPARPTSAGVARPTSGAAAAGGSAGPVSPGGEMGATRRTTVPALGSSPLRCYPGLPATIGVPDAALHPTLVLAQPPGEGRDRDTVVVRRSRRGSKELEPRNIEPTAEQLARRDFSHYYPPPVRLYDRSKVDELCYTRASKARAAERRRHEEEREARELAAARALYLVGGVTRKGSFKVGSETTAEPADKEAAFKSFLERQDASEQRRLHYKSMLAAEQEAFNAAKDKKVCPVCGTPQTFQEHRMGQRRCTRAACGKAPFSVPGLHWPAVRAEFLRRASDFETKREEHRAALLEEMTPPFRMTHRLAYDPAARALVEEEVPDPPSWEAVEAEFQKRNEAAIDKLMGRGEWAEAELVKMEEAFRRRAEERPKPHAKPFVFTRPLPTFEERQAASQALKLMTFEERVEALGPG